MTRRAQPRPPQEAVILCVELTQRVDRDGWHWDILLSRAGSSVAASKTWDGRSGLLSADQALDLQSFVGKAVQDALLAWGGVQGVL